MVEQDQGEKKVRKETPAQAFSKAKRGFNEALASEYSFGDLKEGLQKISSTGVKAFHTPDKLYPQMVSFGEKALVKAAGSNDLQGVGYFSGLIEGFQMTIDNLAENQAQKPPQQARSMNQAKA